MTNPPPKRRFVAVLTVALAAALMLLAAGAASASAATIGPLRSGSSSGPENYLYTAGNQVFAPVPGTLNASDAYRFEVIAPDGSVKHTLSTCFSGNAAAGDNYTIGVSDQGSGATGYRWVLENFNPGNKNANLAACNIAPAGTGAVAATKYFDVVVPTVDGTTGFSGNQRLFTPTQTAYTRFAGVVNRNPDTGAASAGPAWSTTWLNGTAAVCANTAGADRPDSSGTGQLPTSAPAYLQFPPQAGAGGAFNDVTNYDGSLCTPPQTGAYSVQLTASATQSVRVPVFNVDATPPALTLNTPADTNATTPSFSGAAGTQTASSSAFADGASVAIRIYSGMTTSGSPARTFTKTQSAGAWSLSASDWSGQGQPALGEGLYTVVVEQSDGGGNLAQSSGVFKVDTTAPALTLTSPAGASQLNDTTPAFGGQAGNVGALTNATADAQTVTLRIYSGHNATGLPARTIPVTKTGNQWAIGDADWTAAAQTALAAGTWTAQAEQLDGAGNQGLSGAVTFKVDPTAPAVDITAPADGLDTTGATPAIAGSSGTTGASDFASADLATVTVKVYSGTTATGTAQRTFSVNGGGGSWSVGGADWTAQGALSQGQWTIQAEQSDEAGNIGRSSTRTIRVDQQAPFSGTSVATATSSASISVGYTDNDLGSSQSGVKQIVLYAKGPGDAAFAQAGSVTNPAATGSFSYTATKGQGRYFFATVATDNAGNSESAPVDGGVGKAFTHYDTTAPVVTLDTWPAIGNDTTPALAGGAGSSIGTGEPAADAPTLTVDIWSGTDTNQLPARSIPITRNGGLWTLDDSAWNIADSTLAPLTEGTWTAIAHQSDEAGNTGASATPRTFVVDLHAPASSDDVPTTWQKNPVSVHLSATDTGGSAGTTIHYTTDGSTPTLSSPSYSSAITVGNAQSIKYFAVDTAGNAEGVHTSPAAMVDQQAPTTTDNVPPTFQANDVSVTLNAVDTGGSGLDKTYYTTDGTDPTTSSAVYSGPVTLQNGQSIKYFSTDVAGNAEAAHASAAAKVDKSAPGSQGSAPAYAHQEPITVAYTAGDGGSGLKRVELWAKAPGATSFSLATADTTPGTSGNLQYTGSGDGVYSFYTLAEDNVGNREAVDTSSGQVTSTLLDTVAPSTSDNAPAGYVNHDLSVTLSASDPGGSGVASTRYTTDGTTPTVSSAAYSAPVVLTSDGQQLKYRSIDNAGNLESVRSVTAHIDRLAPATHAGGSAVPTNNASFTVGYTASDAAPTSGLDHVVLFAKGPADSAYAQAGDDTTPAAGGSFGYTATEGDGTYRFYTIGYDQAGNVEAFSSSNVVTIALDTAPPTLAVTAFGATLTDDTPHVAGTSDDPAQVTVRLYSGGSAIGSPLQTATASVSGGAWSIDATHLEDGQYTVQAQQTDAAGNSTTSSPQTFTLDAHPPIPAITTPVTGARANDATPAIGGTASTVSGDVQQVTVRVYPGSSASGTALPAKTAPVAGDGSWSVDADSLTDGTYTAQADQADTATNHGLSNPVTFTIDTGVPSSQATAPGLARSTSIAVSYAAQDTANGTGLSTVELWSKGPGDAAYAKVAEDLTPSASGSLAYVAGKGDGTYRFYTVAVDRAGNREAAPVSDAGARVASTGLDTHSPSITSANQGQSYVQGSSVAADYGCSDEAGGSGIDTCAGDVARGGPLDTATPGPHSYHVTGRDRAGNELGATISYTVTEQHVEPGPPDAQPPHVNSAGTRRSQALTGGALNLDVVCDEACDVNASGTISLPGGARVYRLKGVARKAAAGAHAKLKLKLDKATLKAVRATLRKHGKVAAKVKLIATDAAGNRRVSTLTVRITRA